MFKDNLRIIRENRELTKQQMAEKLDIPYVTYSHYENKGSEPPYRILKRIAQILCTSIDVLLADELPNISATAESILSMRELPPTDSIKFTPYYAFNTCDDIKSWKNLWVALENNKLEECHALALKKACDTYQGFLIMYTQNTIEKGTPKPFPLFSEI